MNTLETTEQLKQRIIDRCAPKDTARRTELKEMLDALIAKAQESQREADSLICEEFSCTSECEYSQDHSTFTADHLAEVIRGTE